MIENWLEQFKILWLNKNIDDILKLFADDVIYYETPYKKIINKFELQKEWEYIINHEIKKLDFEIFINDKSKNVVKFRYEYILNWNEKMYNWIYLVNLENWKCNYFYQVWE